jgi:hypothetical protein
MVPDQDRSRAEFKALIRQKPGGAITCPYCQKGVEYGIDGNSLVESSMVPLRFSRTKMEIRFRDYGNQKTPPVLQMTPEQWIAEEKLMPGALCAYKYVEDLQP